MERRRIIMAKQQHEEEVKFILEIKKGNADDKGRKTKTWDRPLIVVYAEDQEPFSGK